LIRKFKHDHLSKYKMIK